MLLFNIIFEYYTQNRAYKTSYTNILNVLNIRIHMLLLLLFKDDIYANLFMGYNGEYCNRPDQLYMYSLRLKQTPCIIYFKQYVYATWILK